MTAIKNLWSEDLLKGEDTLLPVTILQQQANYLNEMTRNIIVANIDTKRRNFTSNMNVNKIGIEHIFKIVAPAIGNYDFALVAVAQSQLLPYPLKVYSYLTEQEFDVADSEGLEHVLQLVFNHPKTISAIQSLILQSK